MLSAAVSSYIVYSPPLQLWDLLPSAICNQRLWLGTQKSALRLQLATVWQLLLHYGRSLSAVDALVAPLSVSLGDAAADAVVDADADADALPDADAVRIAVGAGWKAEIRDVQRGRRRGAIRLIIDSAAIARQTGKHREKFYYYNIKILIVQLYVHLQVAGVGVSYLDNVDTQ